jgi:hypothetical protein
MLRASVTTQTIVLTLRNRLHRLRDERGAEAVRVDMGVGTALIIAAVARVLG